MDKPDISGRWLSTGVETRRAANGATRYLRREFRIDSARSAGELRFFAEAEGRTPTLTLRLEGPYEMVRPSSAVEGAWEANFHFDTAKITAHTEHYVSLLNSAPPGSGGTEKWVAGVEQDVTPTGGCKALGIDLAHHATEYELVKREGHQLFYGARPEDGGLLDTPERRPRALQVPLVKA